MSGKTDTKKAICMWCHSHCRVSAVIENGRLVRVEEDKDHPWGSLFTPITKGCLRARAAAEWFYHPDRLGYPLKRAGEKGEGKWQRISWEQALDEIAENLRQIRDKHGAEAIGNTSGTGRTHDEYRDRFFHLLGSPNSIGQGEICWGPHITAGHTFFGWTPFPVVRPETNCILAWGGGIPMYLPPLWHASRKAMRRGAKFIVVDPRRIESAEKADIWLQLRPGTDCALAMGMINVIISEGLYDKEFVDKWCHGFDKLAERAQEYAPEKVADITWVPAEKIKEAARMYATNKPAGSIQGMGVEHLPNSMEALHARFILPAITGNIDIKGGDLLEGPPVKVITAKEIELAEKLPPEQRKKALGADRFKLMAWPGYELLEPNVKRVWGKMGGDVAIEFPAHAPTVYRAIITGKPYPVRAMITLSSNPMVTQANTKLVFKALKSLDLYVVMDFWMTPSAELADYVLPAASWLERPHIHDMFGTSKTVLACEAAMPSSVEGQYHRKRDYDLWRELGIRLGQEEYWPWKTLEEAYDYRLAPLGYTLKGFMDKKEKGGFDIPPTLYKKYEKTGFGTPTRKVELYSTVLEELGYDPLPRYEEPHESPVSNPELAREYPLILITGGRFNPMYHSEHRQIESLRKRHPDPIMQLHPKKAEELDIKDGDWVWIETPRGRIRQRCRYFEGMDPRVVHVQHGWWFPELPGEEPWLHGVWMSNANVLTDDDPEHCNKINGGWPLRTALCKVYKVRTY